MAKGTMIGGGGGTQLPENIVNDFNGRTGSVLPEAGDYTATQVGADPVGSASEVQGHLNTHIGNKANPHAVTAAQAGADPAGSASTVQGHLDAHIGDKDNPHEVTALQVGTLTEQEIRDLVAGSGFLHYNGVISATDPVQAGMIPNVHTKNYWYESSSTDFPTTFPLAVKSWDFGTSAWIDYSYTPESGDLWSNLNITSGSNGKYWFSNEWNTLDFSIDLTQYRTAADQDIVDATKADKTELANYVPISQKGSNNGVATLDATGKVPVAQIPELPYATLTWISDNLWTTDIVIPAGAWTQDNYAQISITGLLSTDMCRVEQLFNTGTTEADVKALRTDWAKTYTNESFVDYLRIYCYAIPVNSLSARVYVERAYGQK